MPDEELPDCFLEESLDLLEEELPDLSEEELPDLPDEELPDCFLEESLSEEEPLDCSFLLELDVVVILFCFKCYKLITVQRSAYTTPKALHSGQ